MTIHSSLPISGGIPLSEKSFSPLRDFEPAPFSADEAASAELHDRLNTVREKLNTIREGHGQLDRERSALREAIISRFEIANLEKIKQIPWRRFQLFQDEAAARLDLESWFSDYRSEISGLITEARSAMAAAVEEVRASILALGYDKEKVGHHLHHGKVGADGSGEHDSLVVEHPKVKEATQRFHALDYIRDDLNLALDTGRRRNKERGVILYELMDRMLAKAIDHADSL